MSAEPTSQSRLLTHATDVIGRPVVTTAGEDIAQVRDVLFTRDGGVRGFTLAGRGLFSGPMERWLPWERVRGFGPAALVIDAEDAVVDQRPGDVEGDVVGDEVLTRSGTRIGTVIDAVLRLEPEGLGSDGLESHALDVVGYEVEPADGGDPRFVPLPDTLAVSAGRLVVPDEALEFLTADMAGFGAAVDTFRTRLRGGSA